jgi:hypothetical protein
MDDYNKLIPSPDTRVEIDRAPGKEEIRVIKDETGDYHVTADHDIARDVLKEIDQQTIDIFKPDINPYPKSFSNLKNEDYFRDIIRYDEAGNRILPGIRRVGFLSTMEEYNAMENDDVVWYESWKFTGVENTRTGDVWWTTDALKKEILQRRPPQDKEDEATPQGEGETSDDQ